MELTEGFKIILIGTKAARYLLTAGARAQSEPSSQNSKLNSLRAPELRPIKKVKVKSARLTQVDASGVPHQEQYLW